MNKFLALLTVAGVVFSAAASPIDITIDDGLSSGKTGPDYQAGSEDQSLNFGSTWGQEWDLEAFYYDKTTSELQMVGGFDVFEQHAQSIMLGDVFVKTSGSNDWSYAITFNRDADNGIFSNYEYSIVDLTAGDFEYLPLQGSFEESKSEAKPYAISKDDWEDGSVRYQGTFSFDEYTTTSFIGDEHFLLSDINLSSVVGSGESFLVHQTMSCGNDVLKGNVPEPTIISFLGIGLIGIAFFRRKK